jgi:hypothetical protein
MAARRLKVFQAHLGFYDTVVAAPSQKAALEAWGTRPTEFAKGFAKLADDPAAIKAALAHPGHVLRRPFGTAGDYKLEPAPVPSPKPTAKTRKTSVAAKKQRAMLEADARAAAARELREAKREEARALSALKARELELAREKAAAVAESKERIARAKSRLRGVKK